MAAVSRLGTQIAELTASLTRIAVPHALIGGLALASHNRAKLDFAEVRQYFQLFDRESLLDELLQQLD